MPEPTQTSTPSSPASSSPEKAPTEVQLTADTGAISDLFAKAPLEWNEADMTRVVEYYRKMRKDLDAAPAKKPAAAKIPKEDLSGISADDLLSKLGL